jgi:hypothetical protein
MNLLKSELNVDDYMCVVSSQKQNKTKQQMEFSFLHF